MRFYAAALPCILLGGTLLYGQNSSAGTYPAPSSSADQAQGQQDTSDDNPPVLRRRPKPNPDQSNDSGSQPSVSQPTVSQQPVPQPPVYSQPTTPDREAQQSTTDDNPPVLKRRPKPSAGDVEDSNAGATQQAPVYSQPGNQQDQSAPVFGQRRIGPTTIPAATSVPLNTQFQVALDQNLSTKTSHSGDSFSATLSEPLRNSRGDVLIPSGTRLLGTVQEAEPGRIFASMRGKGRLILRFNDIELSNGQRLPIQTTLLHLGTNKAQATANQEGEITSGTKAGDAIKKVGIGAGAGTIAGLIFGSAAKGAAIGAIAGGGYAMANAGRDVEVPAHTTMNLRLDQYLVVPPGTAQIRP